jgi:hypothetical protein
MSRNSNVGFVKPTLEELEDRIQPSFLLSSTPIPVMVTLMNNIIGDMKVQIADVKAQHDVIVAPFNSLGTLGAQEAALAKGAADWQRILVDQETIRASVSVDLSFINAAASAELSMGDPIDEIVLMFGPLLNLNPTSALSATVTQANNLINNDSTLQTDIDTDFFPISNLSTHSTFKQLAGTVGPLG